MHLKGRSLVCDLSCLLRCSLLLKARLQNWHLYFFSGASDDFLIADDDAAVGSTDILATGILGVGVWVVFSLSSFLHRAMVEIVWLASVGVGFKVCTDYVDMCCSFVSFLLSSMGVVV
jgi:hypothetical protein